MYRYSTLLTAVVLSAWAVGAERAPEPRAADPVSFDEVVRAAAADPAGSPTTYYLSAPHLSPADRDELYAVISVHVNLLSKGPQAEPPRKVAEWLWAVDARTYRWDAKVWDDLRRVNTYYCLPVQVAPVEVAPVKRSLTEKVTKTRTVYRRDARGQLYPVTEEYTEDVTREVVEPVANVGKPKDDFVAAPWLPTKEVGTLLTRTGTVSPIVRADEFLFQTGAQRGRTGHGYYDFLGLKSRADAEKLAALDRKTAEDRFREMAAIFDKSGVSPNNRQVFWYRTVAGSWWETRDSNTSKGKQNAMVQKLRDYKHDAEEVVYTLPNRGPGFYLATADGKQVDSAPDTIASDAKTVNNSAVVEVCYSCVVCHDQGGLKPIDRDRSREVYSAERGGRLTVLDPELSSRLVSVYLGPIQEEYDDDSKRYSRWTEKLSGLKPTEFARAYQRQFSKYLDSPVTLEVAAAECGTTPALLRAAIRRYAATKPGAGNDTLVSLSYDRPLPLRREHWEEVFPIAMLVLGGQTP